MSDERKTINPVHEFEFHRVVVTETVRYTVNVPADMVDGLAQAIEFAKNEVAGGEAEPQVIEVEAVIVEETDHAQTQGD